MSASQKGAAQSVILPGKIECHIECSEKRIEQSASSGAIVGQNRARSSLPPPSNSSLHPTRRTSSRRALRHQTPDAYHFHPMCELAPLTGEEQRCCVHGSARGRRPTVLWSFGLRIGGVRHPRRDKLMERILENVAAGMPFAPLRGHF